MSGHRFDVVIPTVGRPSLATLLQSLTHTQGPRPQRVLVVDDRPERVQGLDRMVPEALRDSVKIIDGPARGPAAARNVGWRHGDSDWVAFLDDDVVLSSTWAADLARDLSGLGGAVAGSQGRIRVPLPQDRLPTDWERNVAGLERAVWATADLAYRRAALEAANGFDERFPRAYREDADLGLRLTRAGWRIVAGERTITHPVRPADRMVSLRLQRGNADDALLLAVHGRRWRAAAHVPRGRRAQHVATTTAAFTAAGAALAGRRGLTALTGLAWLGATAEFAWRRIAPGPGTRDEVATMVLTSAAIPPAATWHWLRGLATVTRRRATPVATRGPAPDRFSARAVLFDRDGTLVVDEPYNGDPSKVRLMPGARAAVGRVRAAGLPIGVVSNQSGVGRGLITAEQVEAVNRRVQELLGPVDAWVYCPHAPDDGCDCRKPAPGMVVAAARALGVAPSECALIGDIGADVDAALAAGARPVLVPTAITREAEVLSAPLVATDLSAAVETILGEPA